MDLDFYLWKLKISQRELSARTGISTTRLNAFVKKLSTPSLVSAIKIHEATDGKVGYKDMIREVDRLTLEEEKELAEKAKIY